MAFRRFKPLPACGIGLVAGLLIVGAALFCVVAFNVWFAWAVPALVQLPMAFVGSVVLRASGAEGVSGESAVSPEPSVTELPMSEPRSDLEVPGYMRVKKIGKGAYGEVWLCKDQVGRFFPVKYVYRNRWLEDTPYQREFRGLQTFAKLDHTSLLRVMHVSINEDKQFFYYVMEAADDKETGRKIIPDEYAPRTLASDLQARKRLPPRECIKLGASLAEGLVQLHLNQLVHRDIKPANIIFVDGIPKLADIGLVTEVDLGVSEVGTPGYMDLQNVGTIMGDLFSLGKVLYVAATGLDPGRFPEFPALDEADAQEPCRAGLYGIIRKACAPAVADRFPSVAAMERALTDLLKNAEAKEPIIAGERPPVGDLQKDDRAQG